MSGLTMGYTDGFYTASSARKFGEWIETPAPSILHGNYNHCPGCSLTSSNLITSSNITASQFADTGRRPYSVNILNDRSGDIFFCFDKSEGFRDFGANRDDNSITTFEMSPIAWSGSHADSAAGDVVFLYRGDM